jgi:hypothetical protein
LGGNDNVTAVVEDPELAWDPPVKIGVPVVVVDHVGVDVKREGPVGAGHLEGEVEGGEEGDEGGEGQGGGVEGYVGEGILEQRR